MHPMGNSKKWLYSFVFYFFCFSAVAFLFPNMVLYYQGLGFTGLQIGLLTGIAPLITLVGAPMWTSLADAKRAQKLILSLTLLVSVLLVSIFPTLEIFVLVILLVGLFSLFYSPVLSFSDSATMAALADRREMYGRVRLGGTIGFGLAAPLTGIILQAYGIRWAFWGFSLLTFLAFFVSLKFTFDNKTEFESIKWDLRWVVNNRGWQLFLAMAFIGGMAFTTINSYLFSYMTELGINRTVMGIALALSTLGELPVLLFSNRLIKRFKAYGLFLLGVTITGIRLLLYAIFSSTAGILVFQFLNGMTFPMMWVAGVTYAYEHAPTGLKSTGQGLFAAMMVGIGAACGNFLGGLLLGSIGGRWMYLVLGCIVFTCIGGILFLGKAWRTQEARSIP